jgi:hypothetical protein
MPEESALSASESPSPTAEVTPGAPASAAWVDRARAILRIAVIVTASLSVVMTLTLIVLSSLGLGTAANVITGTAEWLTWFLIFVGPVLFVIAMNVLVWRSLLRGLARRTLNEAIVLAAVATLLLAVASMISVAVLVLLGFFAGVFVGF